jgi:hypothetical protein
MPASPVITISALSGMAFAYTVSPGIQVSWSSGFSASPGGSATSAQIEVLWQSGMAAVIPAYQFATVEVDWQSGMTMAGGLVGNVRAGIRSAIQDVLSMWGKGCCTEAPEDCAMQEALIAVNQGLQQFYQSTKAHEFLVVTKEVRYSWSPPGENAFKMFSLTGVDLPSPLATDDTSGNTTRHFQHISRVTYSYTPDGSTDMRTVLMRAAASSGQAAAYAGIADAVPGSTMLEWFDAPSSDIPLLFEVFRGEDARPKIRGWPFRSRTGTEFATVTYFEAAKPVTALDYSNGSDFDIAPQYVELYLMPLCRHAALSSRYMDPRAAPQSKAIEDRYQEVLAFLGLADIQPTEVA